jgi:hypothetical protein
MWTARAGISQDRTSMIRLLVTVLLTLIANAVAVIVAAVVLDDMTLDAGAFIVEIAIFTAVVFVIRPLIVQIGLQQAPAIAGSSALLATLVGLIVTSVLSDGLQIRGADTWVLATIIVWLISMVGALILPALFLKRKVGGSATVRRR